MLSQSKKHGIKRVSMVWSRMTGEQKQRRASRGATMRNLASSPKQRQERARKAGLVSSGKMAPEQLHARAVKAARARWGKGEGEGEEAKLVLTQAVLDEMRDELLLDHFPPGDMVVPWGWGVEDDET